MFVYKPHVVFVLVCLAVGVFGSGCSVLSQFQFQAQLYQQQSNQQVANTHTVPLLGTQYVSEICKNPATNRFHRDQAAWAVDMGHERDEPIYATVSGTVTKAETITGYYVGYGNTVVITETNGNEHWFAHLSHIPVVAGQTVQAGDLIGFMGNSGNNPSMAVHLHYHIQNSHGQAVPVYGHPAFKMNVKYDCNNPTHDPNSRDRFDYMATTDVQRHINNPVASCQEFQQRFPKQLWLCLTTLIAVEMLIFWQKKTPIHLIIRVLIRCIFSQSIFIPYS